MHGQKQSLNRERKRARIFGVSQPLKSRNRRIMEYLLESIKSKVNKLKKKTTNSKKKKPYVKMDKSASVKVEIRSRKARNLINKTLQAADRPGNRAIS
ncbi:hypothetical protein RIF29_22755 [Crotalaria pallida]|uniref:Uncharacterized protein n=1 Tax=Crotalaria pallida TaxID=3830 RepID=A0AAN9F9N1_CROPI